MVNVDEKYGDEPFYKETFYDVSSTAISMRGKVHQTGGKNVRHTQVTQQRDYNRRHQVSNNIKAGQKVILKKQDREESKWGKFSFKQLGLTQCMPSQ